MEYEEVKNQVWNPEKTGDQLEGIYVTKEEGKYGNNYILETQNGEKIVVFGSTVLHTAFNSIESGTQIRITYEGLVKGESGNEYKNYKVEKAKQ